MLHGQPVQMLFFKALPFKAKTISVQRNILVPFQKRPPPLRPDPSAENWYWYRQGTNCISLYPAVSFEITRSHLSVFLFSLIETLLIFFAFFVRVLIADQ